jgi:hypothetical protein
MMTTTPACVGVHSTDALDDDTVSARSNAIITISHSVVYLQSKNLRHCEMSFLSWAHIVETYSIHQASTPIAFKTVLEPHFCPI